MFETVVKLQNTTSASDVPWRLAASETGLGWPFHRRRLPLRQLHFHQEA